MPNKYIDGKSEKWKETYEKIKASCLKEGKSEEECKTLAAATCNKMGLTSPDFYIALTEAVNEIKILYPGNFKHSAYGEFDVTEENLKKAVDNFNSGIGVRFSQAGEKELPCTYEHPRGDESDPERTKASGWIKRLFLRDGALWALVNWTEKASEYIRKKEFRYISPVFFENWRDEAGKGHGFTILGLGLTNVPFLKKGQAALALSETDVIHFNNDDQEQTEETMDKEILEALELKEGGDVLAAVKSLKETASKLKDSEHEIKRLKEQIETMKPKDGEVRLTEAKFKTLSDGAATAIKLQEQIRKNEAEALVDKAISEGKLTPAQKESAMKIALTDRASFDLFMKDAKPVIGFKEKGSGGEGKEENSNPKIALNDAVTKVMTEKKVSFTEASPLLRKDKPELFEAAGY